MSSNNEACYGISTASGLQRAAAQGQKIYQIDQNNKAQLANIAMSGEDMANDINKAINSGGYVVVPEKAVDGVGRNAIYVYLTVDGQTGNQAWKISGGLNGGWFENLLMKSQFLIGSLLGVFEKLPAVLKIALRSVLKVTLTLLATLQNLISLMLNCKHLSFAIVLTVSILLFDLVIGAFLLLTGVGGFLALAFNAALAVLENKIIDYFKEDSVCKEF